jgi:hypothetical protein
LACGHTGRPAVPRSFIAPSLVTHGVAEDPPRENDDMIGAHAKVGVPALTVNQGIRQRGGELVSDIVRALDIKQRPYIGLVRCGSLGDVLPIEARYVKVADPQSTSDAKALGDNPSVQHDEMIASGSDNPPREVPR